MSKQNWPNATRPDQPRPTEHAEQPQCRCGMDGTVVEIEEHVQRMNQRPHNAAGDYHAIETGPQHAPSGEPQEADHHSDERAVPRCYRCGLPWPCDATTLLAELAQRTAELEQRNQELHAIRISRDAWHAAVSSRDQSVLAETLTKLGVKDADLRVELAQVWQQRDQYLEERNTARAEVERVKANHVTVAEEIQRRHDAVASLAAKLQQARAVVSAARELEAIDHGVAWPDLAHAVHALDATPAVGEQES